MYPKDMPVKFERDGEVHINGKVIGRWYPSGWSQPERGAPHWELPESKTTEEEPNADGGWGVFCEPPARENLPPRFLTQGERIVEYASKAEAKKQADDCSETKNGWKYSARRIGLIALL